MNEWWRYLFAAIAGGLLGGFFLASLWWTVGRLPQSRRPALLFAASFLVRMLVVLGGFLTLAMTGDWKLLVAAGAGFQWCDQHTEQGRGLCADTHPWCADCRAGCGKGQTKRRKLPACDAAGNAGRQPAPRR